MTPERAKDLIAVGKTKATSKLTWAEAAEKEMSKEEDRFVRNKWMSLPGHFTYDTTLIMIANGR
jgi:hypothetical protein